SIATGADVRTGVGRRFIILSTLLVAVNTSLRTSLRSARSITKCSRCILILRDGIRGERRGNFWFRIELDGNPDGYLRSSSRRRGKRALREALKRLIKQRRSSRLNCMAPLVGSNDFTFFSRKMRSLKISLLLSLN